MWNIDELKQGSIPEFNKFYKHFQPKVKGLIKYYGYNLTVEEVEDITQDTFTKAFRGLPKCKAETERSIFAWLGTTLRNATYDYVKKKNRKEIIENKLISVCRTDQRTEPDLVNDILNDESVDHFHNYLKQTFNGVLLYEKAILGKTNKELSEKYKFSTSSISQRILREKKRINKKGKEDLLILQK